MRRRFVATLLALAAAGAVTGRAAAQGAAEVVVDAAGPVRTLAAGVAAVRPGGRVVVRPGVYREPTVVVRKPVTIEGVAWPVVDGERAREILRIEADDVTVRGLVLRDVGTSYVEDRAAVKVDGARRCVIEGNRIERAFFGIYLAKAADCRIVGNEVVGADTTETSAGNGIHLWYSRGVEIRGNRVTGHRDGIYLEFVKKSRITGNVSERNLRYGLHFMFSDSCVYRENTFRDNDAGVAVMYTKNVEMRRNRFEHNWGGSSYGLLLKDITDSTVEDNLFARNSVGVLAEGSNRVRVEGNEFVENGWAVRIMANAVDNLFTRNNFVGNSFDVATNSRQSFSEFRGNYWDRYRGYDLDGDGAGDVPYRPVRLFSLVAERYPPSLILLRSLFVELLNTAERMLPALTPGTLVDAAPALEAYR